LLLQLPLKVHAKVQAWAAVKQGSSSRVPATLRHTALIHLMGTSQQQMQEWQQGTKAALQHLWMSMLQLTGRGLFLLQ
jgi:hypothetical protein